MRTLFDDQFDDETATLPEASSLLGVSTATIRNWVKHDYLTPLTVAGKTAFDRKQLIDLKTRISNGEIDRLARRANKTNSALTSVPTEHFTSVELVTAVENIVELFRQEDLDLRATLLSVVLGFLEQKGFATGTATRRLDLMNVRHPVIKEELEWWFANTQEVRSSAYLRLQAFQVPPVRDFLGILYQSLRQEGVNSKFGSYYTPEEVVEKIIAEHVTPAAVVLDPCCGTGQFLLAAAKTVADPSNLWGFELDEVAARLARLNLIACFPEYEFAPNIYCKNTLLAFPFSNCLEGRELPQFDAIFTNPPWGAHFSANELIQLQKLYPEIRSNEAFSLFLLKGLQFLREGGVLSFLLPESILNVKVHADIRYVISKNNQIRKVEYLGRVFKSVFTPVIRLDLVKGRPPRDSSFVVVRNDDSKTVEQSRLQNNPDHIFDLATAGDDLAIFDKMYCRKHVTLQGRADWALGVVTGNNAKFLKDRGEPGYEPILTGKELRRFLADVPRKFIYFAPEQLQQVAPIQKYRAPEKLLYKFISNELIFAYDNQQTLSLNSANVLIPRVDGIAVKVLLAFLNSSLYQLLFQKRFGAFKVLRGDLEQLPFPVVSEVEHQTLICLVDTLLSSVASAREKKKAISELDDQVMNLFGLTQEEKHYVRANAKISPKMLPC